MTKNHTGPRPHSTKQFVEDCKLLFGDKYDYSKIEYVNAHTPIIIGCKVHGNFEQLPYHHKKGHGCYRCYGTKNTEDFIEKARKIHFDEQYDYSKVEYIKCNLQVKIMCKTHGEFLQTPQCHFSNKICCPSCLDAKKLTTEKIVLQFKKIHGEKFDYSKVIYVSNAKHVVIVCKFHGDFRQSPGNHVRGTGCPLCAGRKHKRI